MLLALLLALGAECPATDPTGAVPVDSPRLPVGQVEPRWCEQGVDLFALAGPDVNPPQQVVMRDEGGGYLDRYQHEPWTPPAGWRLLGSRAGSAPPHGEFYNVQVQFEGKRLVLITQNPAWRIGKAICITESGPTAVYLVAEGRPTGADLAAMHRLIGEPQRQPPATLCVTAFARKGGDYTVRFHNTSGRSADSLNEIYAGTSMRIVPRGPIEAYRPVTR
jgi:hypothetical protein